MDRGLLLYYISGFPREMLFACIFFALPLERRRDRRKHLPLVFLLTFGEMLLFAAVFGMVVPPLSGQLFFALHFLAVCAVFAADLKLLFNISWTEAAYCVVCAYIGEHMAYCCENLLTEFLPVAPFTGTWWWYILMHLPIYTLIYLLFIRKMCTNGHYEASSVRSVYLIAPVFMLVYVISLVAIDLGLEWLHALYALICCSFMLISEYRYTLHLRAEAELIGKEHLWEMSRAQYQMTAEHIETINLKCHDLKHQINALRSIDDRQTRNHAIRSMEEAVMIYDSSYKTGSHTLDMVLTQKALRCNQLSIPLSVMADGKVLNFMDDIDLYTMLANILDNAIEANERIEDRDRRSISLSVHCKKGLVILQSENPYVGDLQLKDGLPVTTKDDHGSHGFGTRSIVYTVEKYGGFLSIDPGNQMFVLRAVFPNRC